MPRSRRARRFAIAALVGGVVALGGGGGAFASSAPDDGEYVVVYQATATSVDTGPDGVGNAQPVETGQIRLVCSVDECVVAEAPGLYKLDEMPFDPRVGMANKDFPGKDDACLRDEPSPASASLIASASSFAATVDQPAVGWDDCGGGDRIYVHAYVTTWRGTDATGDVCVFSTEGCDPEPTPSASATLLAAGPVDAEPAALSTSELATGDAAAPSVLSSLATPAEAGTAPSQLLLATALAVVLVLLVAFPTALLNSAVESGSDRLSGWWRSRRAPTSAETSAGEDPRPDGESDEPPRTAPWTKTWWWAAAGVVAASVVSAFVDPGFGFNVGSVRVVLSILVSFAIDVVLGWMLVVWLTRRLAPGVTHSYVFQPLTLLVVVAAVVFTRITAFEPGIVFGLVAGVAFGALVGRAQQARAALVTLGYAFAVALVAWVAYGLLGGGAAAGGSFWGTFAIETLSSVAIGGMAALPIALFPVRGLAGYAIWGWSRRVWAGCYAVGLFAFFVVLMPMPFSWDEVSLNLATWIGVYLAYAVVAVVAWLLITTPWRKDAPEAPEGAPADDAEEGAPEHVGRLDG